MIQDPLAVVAVLLGVIFVSLRLIGRYPWAARLSAIIWIIFLSALASNLGLIPTDAPVYGALVDFAVPFAVCVILFTVNLSDVRKAGGPMLAAFALASLGTVLGVAAASLTLEPFLARILAAESWKLAGPYTGTYIGGSLNFFALWQGLEIGNPDLFAAANAVDNLTLFPLYACWMVIPTLLAGRWAVAKRWEARFDDEDEAATAAADKPRLVPVQVATLVFLAMAVMAVSGWLKTAVVDRVFPDLPAILIVTTLALALGQLPSVRRLEGAWEIGDLAFYVFFAAVGALIDFYQAVVLSPILFLYVVVIMAVHMAVLYGGGRWLRMDVAVLTIASVATKAGPALIAPVAETRGWRHLVLPGIVVAMLGYAVGNYVGYAVAQAVRAVVGGIVGPSMDAPSPAEALHRGAIVVDAHTDSLQRVLMSGDDFGKRTEGDPLVERADFPRYREGGVDAQVFAVWVDTIFLPHHGVRRALQQIDAFFSVLDANPGAVAFARGRACVEAAAAGGKLAALLSIEGGDAIGGDLAVLRLFHRLGACSMTLCHSRTTDWVDSSTDEPRWGGLNDFGVEVLQEMNRLGMVIDVSHASDAAVRQAIEVSRAPVIASHSNSRVLCDHPRNLSDELLSAIAASGGVVGVNFYSGFLDQAYRDLFLETHGDVFNRFNAPPSAPREELEDLARERLYRMGKDDLPRPPFEILLDHVDHAVAQAGVDHVCLGGDLDLPYMSTPLGLDDVTAYPRITSGLVDRGYSAEAVRKILGENFLRVLADVQSAAEGPPGP